jgi:DNA-binding transcriptional MocR family regulator
MAGSPPTEPWAASRAVADSTACTGPDFSEAATRLAVAVVPGALLSPHGAADDHIRLVYAWPPEVLDEGVRRLAAA